MHGNNVFLKNIEPNLIKRFIIAENIFGIYRNFSLFSTPIKSIVIFRILAELSLAGYILLTKGVMLQDVALFLSNFHAIVSLLISWYYSKTYIVFAGYLTTNHIAYKNDTKYSSRIDKFIKRGFVIYVVYFITLIFLLLSFLHMNVIFTTSKSAVALVMINKAYNHYRYHLEYAFFYLNIRTMSEQLKCIKRSVKSVVSVNHFNEPSIESNVDETDAAILDEIFEKWSKTYVNVKESSRLFNKVFGIQLTSTLFTFVVYYIRVLYTLVDLGIADQKRGLKDGIPLLATSFLSMLVLFIVIHAAHQLKKNAHDLILYLQQALSVCLEPDNTKAYKAIKEFARVVTSRPISVKAFGSISVIMPLIPTCMSIVMSYTVIALQSNNVL